MNAIVTYEQECDGVAIHRVYVGEGNVGEMEREFREDIKKQFGPQPELTYVYKKDAASTYREVDPDSEQVLQNWRATIFQAQSPHKFGEWLVANKKWVECDHVEQQSL